MYTSTLSLISALGGMGGQRHAPSALPPGKTRYPLYRRMGGPQGRSGRVRKISPSTGIRSPDRPARSESLYRLSYRGPSHITQRMVVISYRRFGKTYRFQDSPPNGRERHRKSLSRQALRPGIESGAFGMRIYIQLFISTVGINVGSL